MSKETLHMLIVAEELEAARLDESQETEMVQGIVQSSEEFTETFILQSDANEIGFLGWHEIPEGESAQIEIGSKVEAAVLRRHTHRGETWLVLTGPVSLIA